MPLSYKQFKLLSAQLKQLPMAVDQRNVLISLLSQKPMTDAQINKLSKEAHKLYYQYQLFKEGIEDMKRLSSDDKDGLLAYLIGRSSHLIHKNWKKMQPDDLYDHFFKQAIRDGVGVTSVPTETSQR